MIEITWAVGIIFIHMIVVIGITVRFRARPHVAIVIIIVITILTMWAGKQLATYDAEPLCFGEVGLWDLRSYGTVRMTTEEYIQHCKEDKNDHTE